MALLSVFMSSDSPLTAPQIASNCGLTSDHVEECLQELIRANSVHTRSFFRDGETKSVYWSSYQIPITERQPMTTSPFSEPFDHRSAVERLSDAQIQQEKTWLQNRLRKVNADLENLQYRSKLKIDEESEQKLDELADQWMSANHEMLWDLLSLAKKNNPYMTMDRLLMELRIQPETVGWDKDEEDFVS